MDARTTAIVDALDALTINQLDRITGLDISMTNPGLRRHILADVRDLIRTAYERGAIDPDVPHDRTNEVAEGLRDKTMLTDWPVVVAAHNVTVGEDGIPTPTSGVTTVRAQVEDAMRLVYRTAVDALIQYLESNAPGAGDE